jgi:hypothetical protein
MLGAAGLLSITAGAIVAYLAERFPAQVAAMETAAGAMLLGGFALMGCALPTVI